MLKNSNMRDHVLEFKDSIGTADRLTVLGDTKGPWQDVRWDPHGLRYAYMPSDLEEVL